MNGPEISYAKMMDDALLRAASETQQRFYPLRPSSASKCSRLLAHELMAYEGLAEAKEEYRKPSVHRLLKLGHHIEEQVIDNLELIPDFAVRFKQQVVDFFPLPSGRVVEGSVDAVMWSEKHRCVLDAKSVGDRYHSQFGTKWRGMLRHYSEMQYCVAFEENAFYVEDLASFLKELGPEDSLYDNLMQVNGYACTPFLQARGVDHGVILRYLKNTSELMEIRFKPSMAVFKAVQTKFPAVEEAVLSHKDPLKAPKDYMLGSVKCAYCPYKQDCWPDAKRASFFSKAGGKPKVWASSTSDLEKGKDIEAALKKRTKAEKAQEDLHKLDTEILTLMEGHGVGKIKAANGDVYESVQLSKEVQLRRSKE